MNLLIKRNLNYRIIGSLIGFVISIFGCWVLTDSAVFGLSNLFFVFYRLLFIPFFFVGGVFQILGLFKPDGYGIIISLVLGVLSYTLIGAYVGDILTKKKMK